MVKLSKRMKAKNYRKSIGTRGKSKKELIKQLDELVSKIVRSAGKCAKCGSTKTITTHHAFGRRNMSVRFSLLNLVPLCVGCHIFWAHRNVMDFAVWFEEKIGAKNYEYLKRAASTPVKWTEDELQRLYDDTLEAYEQQISSFAEQAKKDRQKTGDL